MEAAWLAAGTDGVAPVIVVYGESGIGKTRTVAELARVVRARGAEVLWGTCYEGGDAHPYGAWAEAVRGYVERLGADGLAAALGVEVRWLAPLLGDVALPGVERVSAPPGVARLRLAEVLVRVLDCLSIRRWWCWMTCSGRIRNRWSCSATCRGWRGVRCW